MLIDKKDVFKLLCCPILGAKLIQKDGKLVAESSGRPAFDKNKITDY